MSVSQNFLTSSLGVADSIQKAQIYPATERVEINDKFTKLIFSNTSFINGGNYGVDEKRKNKKKNKLITRFSISCDKSDNIYFSEFERDVLSVIISEQKAGNCYTTYNMIFRALIGKVGNKNVRPMKDQKAAIDNAVKKLISTIINFKNLADSLEDIGYIDSSDRPLVAIKESSILPACTLDCFINGQLTEDVVFFDRLSPLLENAEHRNQIVRYHADLLDVPNQRNTPRIIAIKNYILRRIAEIKLHKNMTQTITFDDLFKKCNIAHVNRHVKFDARLATLDLFAHLKDKNFINSFDQVKHGTTIYAVKFSI